MFENKSVPLLISQAHARLGDALFEPGPADVLPIDAGLRLGTPEEIATHMPTVPPLAVDPRVDDLLRRVADLEARVAALEQQTLGAYWHRVVAWLRRLVRWR